MSYFSSYFFGSSKPQEKKEEETEEEQHQQDENKDTKGVNKIVYYANYVKCKAIPSVYLESSEAILKIEFPELFDGDLLFVDKLYAKFKEDAEKFKKESKTSGFEDIERPKEANYYGGIDFHDSEITSLIRSSATDILKQIGKKLMSGDFNLTIVSFPIKVMIPYTILQTIARSFFQFPYYMNLAKDANPVEKLKYTIVATLSSFFCSSIFLKPLNPVLGETYEGMFSDGSKIFLEQTSHHPPNSHFEVYGPNGDWYYAGYSSFSTSAGLNSCTIDNKGKRFIKFKDGTKFEFNYCREYLSNTFWGTLKHESIGEINYEDKKLNMQCTVKLGQLKGEPSDFIEGDIVWKGFPMSKISGSFMSHIEFDDKRYWDIRENYPITFIEVNKHTPSSSIVREDRILLDKDKVENAQTAKEAIENLQRKDRKLREKYHGKH